MRVRRLFSSQASGWRGATPKNPPMWPDGDHKIMYFEPDTINQLKLLRKVHECILYLKGMWIIVVRGRAAIDCSQEQLSNSSHSRMLLSQCDFASPANRWGVTLNSRLETRPRRGWGAGGGFLIGDAPVLSRNKSLRKASTIASLGSKNSHQWN